MSASAIKKVKYESRRQWRQKAEAADFALKLDSMFQYGLVEWEDGSKESGVNVERCREFLEGAQRRGVTVAET